ncbi:unnamed protein product [Diabrotica balteata]|uniref:Uncharacterized protein n=1 Tax=Diabrotica balteata TaxID=107213 RepID=A0A9N9T844_DIABA|nr:unnamed protein product [Diabrotica balteata]
MYREYENGKFMNFHYNSPRPPEYLKKFTTVNMLTYRLKAILRNLEIWQTTFKSTSCQTMMYYISTTLCTMSMALGLGNLYRLPQTTMIRGGLPFLIAHLILTIFIGLPLLFLELGIGQLAQEGFIKSWRVVPFFRGIGYVKFLAGYMLSIYYPLYMGISLYFVIWIAKGSIPLAECSSGVKITEDGYSHYGKDGQKCLRSTFLKSAFEDPYWFGIFASILFAIWAITALLTISKTKSFIRSLVLLIFPTLACLIALFVKSMMYDSELIYFYTKATGVYWKVLMTAIGYCTINIIFGIGSTIISQSLAHHTNVNITANKDDIAELMLVSVIYDIGSASTAADKKLWIIVIFTLFILSGFITMATMTYTLLKAITVGSRARLSWWQASILLSASGFIFGCAILLKEDFDIVHLLDHYIVGNLILITAILEVLTLLAFYGTVSLTNAADWVVPKTSSIEDKEAAERHLQFRGITWGIRPFISWIRKNFNNVSIMITENGKGSTDAGLQDHYRIDFMQKIFSSIRDSMEIDNATVLGYTFWSLYDGFEVQYGYKTISKTKSFIRSLVLLIFPTLACLIALFVKSMMYDSELIYFYTKADWSLLESANVWYYAAIQVFFSSTVGFGSFVTNAGIIYNKVNPFWTAIGYCTINIIFGIGSTIISQSLAHHTNVNITANKDDIAEVMLVSVIYDIGSASTAADKKLWIIVIFTLFILSGFITMATMTYTLLKAITVGSRARLSWWQASILLSASGFMFGCAILLKEDFDIVHLLDHYIVGNLILITAILEVLTLLAFYGCYSNIKKSNNSNCQLNRCNSDLKAKSHLTKK